MNRIEQAVNSFHNPYSCSQTMLASFGPGLGCPEEMCVRVASCFGGGMARTASTCGIITGALMAIGLTYDVNNPNAKDRVYEMAQSFMQQFASRHQALTCRELLGHDISTPEGKAQVDAHNLHEQTCRGLIQSAAEILDQMLPTK